ncbi:MAG: TIGR03792 family protein [Pseudomonadota bacterium]
MIIEHLTLNVPPETRAAFLECDAAIWTTTLAAQAGFLGKETWIEAEAPDRVHLIIRWETREAWKSVPPDLLAATDARMTDAMGAPQAVLSCTDLEVVNPS